MLQALRWSLTHRAVRLAGGAWFGLGKSAGASSPIDPGRIHRVLVVRLDSMGDVVLTAPFLRALRDNLPRAWITLLVRPENANLVELCPHVNEVLTFDPAVSRYWSPLQAASRALRLARSHLWQRGYDLAIAPRWDVDSHYGSMVAFLSGARQRLAYSESVSEEKSRLNAGLDRLLTHAVGGNAPKHEVQRNLDLIASMGGKVAQDGLELWLGEADAQFAARILQEHGIRDGDRLIAIAPGAGHAKRVWPLANFAEFGAWAKAHWGASLVLVGGPGEAPLAKELALRLGKNAVNAAGVASLRETGALLKRCQLFVGNDAGPMHLAAAAGLPVVEISCHPQDGPAGHANSPARFGPWGVPQVILGPAKALDPCSSACSAGLAHCIRGVSVAQVKEAATSLLSQRDQARQ